MANWEQCSAVERDPSKLSGAWVFRGTRVPVSALFENLKDGATVEQFLEWSPGVEAWTVEAVLYRAMAADRKAWSDLDTTVADALYVAEATGRGGTDR